MICDCVVSNDSDGIEPGVLADDGTSAEELAEGAAVDCDEAGIIVTGKLPVDPTEGILESVGDAAVLEAGSLGALVSVGTVVPVDCGSVGTAELEAWF